MTDEKIFADGMIVKRHENAPDFVLANVSFKCQDFHNFMKQHHKDGWVNVQIKRAKSGKLYADLDTFTPSKKEEYDTGMKQAKAAAEPELPDDGIPF